MSIHTDNFETIFGVKSNIKALRNKVLDLAIQGKLVVQDPNDEPASELVKKIKAERNRLVKEGKIKKQKPFKPIEKSEIPFEIPENWEWMRVGEMMTLKSGGSPNKFNVTSIGEYPFIKVGDMNINENKVEIVTSSQFTDLYSPNDLIEINSIIFPKRGGAIATNKKRMVKKRIYIDTNTMALTPIIGAIFDYFKIWFDKFDLWELNSGTAVPQINNQDIEPLVIPLPPINEQLRIVTKIESLMSEIDKLEEFLQKKEYLIELLPKAVVEAIGSCKTGEELKEQLGFVIENFKTVFQTPESMQELRNVVLQLAIEGKLVPQDQNDESALELIKKIQVEREKLVIKGTLKKQKPLKSIEEDEIPFEIPGSWEWVRLGDIVHKLTDGAHATPKYIENGIPFLSVKDMSSGYLDFSNARFISESEHRELFKRCDPEKGDLLITKVGTTGIPVIVNSDKEFSLFVSVALIKFNHDLLYVHFLKDFIKSPYVKKMSEENTQGIGNKNLVLKAIGNFIFPIPPLNEQYRIVQRVKSIMKLIDQMEIELRHKDDLIKKLAV